MSNTSYYIVWFICLAALQKTPKPINAIMICSLKPGVGGIFFLGFVLFALRFQFSSQLIPCAQFKLGNSKAAAHVVADLQCWYTVKPVKKKG